MSCLEEYLDLVIFTLAGWIMCFYVLFKMAKMQDEYNDKIIELRSKLKKKDLLCRLTCNNK